MADLGKKKSIREGHRAVVARRIIEADTLLADIATSGTGDVTKVAQLKLTLVERLALLKKFDDEVVDALTDPGEIGLDIDEADKVSEGIYERIAKLEKAMLDLNNAAIKATAPPTSTTRTRLPELDLPTFMVISLHGLHSGMALRQQFMTVPYLLI